MCFRGCLYQIFSGVLNLVLDMPEALACDSGHVILTNLSRHLTCLRCWVECQLHKGARLKARIQFGVSAGVPLRPDVCLCPAAPGQF